MLGVGVGDEAEGVIAEGEFGVAEEGVVGAGNEAAGHSQDRFGGAGLNAGGEFLSLPFEFGAERFGHDSLWRGGKLGLILKDTPK